MAAGPGRRDAAARVARPTPRTPRAGGPKPHRPADVYPLPRTAAGSGGPPAAHRRPTGGCRNRRQLVPTAHLRPTPAASAKNEVYPRAKSRPGAWTATVHPSPGATGRVPRGLGPGRTSPPPHPPDSLCHRLPSCLVGAPGCRRGAASPTLPPRDRQSHGPPGQVPHGGDLLSPRSRSTAGRGETPDSQHLFVRPLDSRSLLLET